MRAITTGRPRFVAIEVKIARLSTEPEQDLDDRLQLTDGGTGLPAAEEQAADGKLDVRVRYQVFFDEVLGECDLAWGYSASGNLVPRVEQDLLAAVVSPW